MPSVLKKRETKFEGLLKNFNLSEWKVIWKPDHTQPSRGKIIPEAKVILVYDEAPEAATETLLHEVLEIKLRPMLKPYRTLVNALIQWADEQVYREKEEAIKDLLPFIISFNEKDKKLEEVMKT